MSFFKDIVDSGEKYNFHTHTEFCDGRSSMDEIARAAREGGFRHLGFSPHSPIPFDSPCNMKKESVRAYSEEIDRLRDVYGDDMRVYKSMEIDFIGTEWGPHTDYFHHLDLDYFLGSVHFLPNQAGIPIDCDGKYPRFAKNLVQAFNRDLRYVVEKYFEHVLMMLEMGGLDILGHFDKISRNASEAQPGIEDEPWYEAYIDDVISHAISAGVAVEVNTKFAVGEDPRFFPSQKWWEKLKGSGLVLVANSDAHEAGLLKTPDNLLIRGDEVKIV